MIRALKACPERSEGRRLGEEASPKGLTPSFRTGVVAEPGPLGHGYAINGVEMNCVE